MSEPIPTVKKLLTNIQEDISLSATSVCNNVTGSSQTIRIGNFKSRNCPFLLDGAINSTVSSVSSNCIQSTDFKTLLDQKVYENLGKLRKIGPGHSKVADDVENVLKTNLNIDQLTSCMASSFNSQTIDVGDIEIDYCPDEEQKGAIIKNIGNKLVSNFMGKCLQSDNPALANALSEIEAPPELQSELDFNAEKSPIETEKIIGIVFGVLFLIGIIIGVAVYFVYKR